MRKYMLLVFLFAILLLVFCGGKEVTMSTSEEIAEIDVSTIGDPLTEIQSNLSNGYANLQQEKYEEGMELIKETYEMIEVTNHVDLPLVNGRIYLYKSLIFAENDLSAQARDACGIASSNISQAESNIDDEVQKAKAVELVTTLEDLSGLLQKGTGQETMDKYEEAFDLINELIALRAGETTGEEETEESSE